MCMYLCALPCIVLVFPQWCSTRVSGVFNAETGQLTSMFVDYIDGARQYLEGENDRDIPILQEIRLHFSNFLYHLIKNTPGESALLLLLLLILWVIIL